MGEAARQLGAVSPPPQGEGRSGLGSRVRGNDTVARAADFSTSAEGQKQEAPPPPETWLTVARAAKLLGVRERSVRRLVERGSIAGEKRDGSLRIALSSLPETVRARVRVTTRPAPLLPPNPNPSPRQGEGPVDPLAGASASERSIAGERLAVIRAWGEWRKNWCDGGRGETAAMAAFCAAAPGRPSRSTLCEWIGAEREGGVAGLLPKRGRPRGRRIDPRLWEMFCALYGRDSKPQAAKVLWYVREYARELGIECPSTDTFLRAWREAKSAGEIIALREGAKAWADKAGPYCRRTTDNLKPNDVWFSDHHQFDVWVWHAASGAAVRPWLTAWMDWRSRRIVAWSIAARSPNGDVVLATFALGAFNEGLPAHIYIDNGKDYRSKGFAGGRPKAGPKFKVAVDKPRALPVIERLGVRAHFANPYNARAKPIERMFREVCEGFSKTRPAGYAGNKPTARPESIAWYMRDPEHRLQDFDAFVFDFGSWLTACYHETGHPEVRGSTRREVWERECGERRTAPEAVLALLMMPGATRTVRRQTVEIFNHGYIAAALAAHEGAEVEVRWAPGDLRAVWVFDGAGRLVCRAVAPDLARFGESVPMQALREARAETRRIAQVIAAGDEARRTLARQPDALTRQIASAKGEPRRAAPVVRPVLTPLNAKDQRLRLAEANESAEAELARARGERDAARDDAMRELAARYGVFEDVDGE